jgi:hypothetical protein
MDPIIGPVEMVEGEEGEFRIRIGRARSGPPADELRVDLQATVAPVASTGDGPPEVDSPNQAPAPRELPGQVVYLADQSIERAFCYRLEAGDATPAERRAGTSRRIITVTASYQDGRKLHRTSRTHTFTIQLNAERVIRRVGNLGAILGLTPKSLRGA